MKTFLKIGIVLISLGIAVCIAMTGFRVGVPWLLAKTEYDRNRPTVEKLVRTQDSLVKIIDSLKTENEKCLTTIKLQEQIISEKNISSSKVKKLQSQISSLKNQLNATDGIK